MTDTSSRPATAPVATRDGSPALDLPAELPVIYDAPRRPLATWSPERIAEVHKIVARTPKLDGRTVNGFGVEAQRELNNHLDELLAYVVTKEAEEGGDIIAQMSSGLDMIGLEDMKKEAEGHQSLPVKIVPALASSRSGLLSLIGQSVSAFQRFRARSKRILAHFDKIETDARREMMALEAHDSRLDTLVDKNLKALRKQEVSLAAGEIILYRERERYTRDREAALATQDAIAIVEVRDFGEQINAFETRLERIHTAVVRGMVNIPKTRLTQSAGRIQYRNVLDTMLFDMPAMKSAIIHLAALKSIRESGSQSEQRQQIRKRLEAIEVDAIDHAFQAAKRTEAGAIAEINDLSAVCTKVIGIIEQGAVIDAENRDSRREAREQLVALQRDFVEGLRDVTARTVEANAP